MITLTEGNDVFELELTENETIDALGGNDQVTIIGTPQDPNEESPHPVLWDLVVQGGDGDDAITVVDLVDSALLYGGEGNDSFYGYHDGNPFDGKEGYEIYGGAGDDYFNTNYAAYGGAGNDRFERGGSGEDGDDIIYSEGGFGGAGSDIIFGGDYGGEASLISESWGGPAMTTFLGVIDMAARDPMSSMRRGLTSLAGRATTSCKVSTRLEGKVAMRF